MKYIIVATRADGALLLVPAVNEDKVECLVNGLLGFGRLFLLDTGQVGPWEPVVFLLHRQTYTVNKALLRNADELLANVEDSDDYEAALDQWEHDLGECAAGSTYRGVTSTFWAPCLSWLKSR